MEPALTEERCNISLSTRFLLDLKFYKPHPSFVGMLPYQSATNSMSERPRSFLGIDNVKLSGPIPVFVFVLLVMIIVIIVQPPVMNVAVCSQSSF